MDKDKFMIELNKKLNSFNDDLQEFINELNRPRTPIGLIVVKDMVSDKPAYITPLCDCPKDLLLRQIHRPNCKAKK